MPLSPVDHRHLTHLLRAARAAGWTYEPVAYRDTHEWASPDGMTVVAWEADWSTLTVRRPLSTSPTGRGSATIPVESVGEALRVLAALDLVPGHIYESTSCLHARTEQDPTRAAELHTYCQSMTGMSGAKRPGVCKFCAARCVCPCHTPPLHD